MNFKNLLLTLLLSSFSSTLLFAQHDFREGYLITNENDTLPGLIDFKGNIRNSISCSFKKTENDSLTVFYPGEIKAYRITDDKFFISGTVPSVEGEKLVFLEYLIQGEANIYFYWDSYGEHYLISKKSGLLKEIIYDERIVVDDHVTYMKESTIHIGILKAYLSDCPEIFKKIEKLKKPNHYNLTSLARDYHQKICKNDNCIIYRKENPPIRVGVEAAMSYIRYNQNKQPFPEKGILFHIWLPRSSNEKLYFKTGYFYSWQNLGYYSDSDRKYSNHKFPLQLEYISSGKVNQAKLSYGLNFYSIEKSGEIHSTSISAGLLHKVFKSLYLSGSLSSEFAPIIPLAIYDRKIYWISYSIDFGLFYKF